MSFVNCDNNPNSYIAFGSISGDTSGLGHTSDNGIMNIWRQTPVTTNNVSVFVAVKFDSSLQIQSISEM